MNDIKHDSETIETEPLPCPFCGKQPVYVVFGACQHQIDCDNNELCLAVVGTPTMRTKEEAFAAWNTRSFPPINSAAPKLLEALEALSGLEVKGHALLARLQFSEEGRALSAKITAAIAEAKGLAA